MKTMTTVCARDCYDTCSLRVALDDAGHITAITGDPDHPVTRGFLCPRGVKDAERRLTNRIPTPCLRRSADMPGGGSHTPTDWQTALDRVADRLRHTLDTAGPEAVLYLDYAGNMGLLTTAFPQRLWNLLGATRTDHTLCSKSGHVGIALHYGETYGLPVDELPAQRLLVFWGFNAAVSAPHLWKLVRQARQRSGAHIVVIDPIRTATAAQADLWLQPHPGTDVALAYGVMQAIIQRGGVDEDFLREWTIGSADLRQAAAQWTAERVEHATGVTWQHVCRLAEWYHARQPAGTLIGIGLQKCDCGADQARAVALIPALLGQHRGFFYSNGAATFFDDSGLSGKTLAPSDQRIVSQVGLADALQRGAFRFVYVNCANPALTLPDQTAVRAGLSRDDVFVVVHDTHWTRTADFADVALPAPVFLEKRDLVVPWGHRYVRYSPRVVEPYTDSRDEVSVMQALATRLRLEHPVLSEDPWQALEHAFADTLENGGWQALLSGTLLRLRVKPLARYTTPSGKIELSASQAAGLDADALPQQTEPGRTADNAFTLLASATANYSHTQFQEVYGAIPTRAVIHPHDGARLGLAEHAEVWIANDRGRMRAVISLSDQVPPGVVWMPRQSEDADGNAQNSLTASQPQALGGGPRFNSTRVVIGKA
jgi:anaerobic selenocysteine-containing dehydrogenase